MPDAAAVILSRTPVNYNARDFVTIAPSAFADRIIERKSPTALNKFVRNGIGGEPNVIASVAGIIISAVSAENRINARNVFRRHERLNVIGHEFNRIVRQI